MSKRTAVAYFAGIPPQNNNLEKPLILKNFIEGVNAAGDTGISHQGFNVLECDVAFIQGFVHEHGKTLPHLLLRRNAVEKQKQVGKRSLIVDSNLFLYADQGNTKTYLRYSFDGVFPTTGFYFDKDIDPARWKKISAELNLPLKNYRKDGKHILVCLQRNGGWSMKGIPVMQWLTDTIREIKKHTDRPIVVRAHPGDKKARRYLHINEPNVFVSWAPNIRNDLLNAWATVVYNSSPSVASLIEGVPVFVTDTDPSVSQVNGVCNTNLKRLEDPKMYDRQEWIERLSMCHWNFNELKSGEAWSFFRRYI
jgi:hypothetical protein